MVGVVSQPIHISSFSLVQNNLQDPLCLLFVRYTTPDGRRFEVDRPIKVALSGERPSRWVSAEAPEPAAAQPRVRIPNAPRRRAATGPAEAAARRPAWSSQRP